jgi:putative Mn2+ efflux pump MntP
MTYLVALGFVLGIDNLRVALSLGMLGLSRRYALRLTLAFAACEALMPLVGLVIGRAIAGSVEPWAEVLGVGALGTCGLYIVWCALRPSERKLPDRDPWLLLGLPLALSLDNLVAGSALGLLGLPVLFSAVVLGGISGGLCFVGIRLGSVLARFLPAKAELIGGAALVALDVRLDRDRQ